MTLFLLGLILGMPLGGTIVAAYLNNIHSSKIKALEDKLSNLIRSQSANAAASIPPQSPKN